MRSHSPWMVPVGLLLAMGTWGHAASLDGQWSLWRSGSGEMPGTAAPWTPVKVPSFLNQQNDKPFLWYRRAFTVPEEFAGRHVFLAFGGVKFVSRVYVNGADMGGHYGGWEPFEIEVTDACRIGQPNELLVRVQDVTGVIDQHVDYGKQGRGVRFIDQARDAVMAPVGSQYTRVGIWQPVGLVARDDVYIEGVFVRTSVRRRQLEVDVTLRNLGDAPRDVHLAARVEEDKITLPETDLTVPAGSSTTVTLKRPWPKPRLWGPEDPHLYHLVTTVAQAAKTLDVHRTRFGFREFWVEGTDLILNGTPMKFLATAGHPRGELDDGLSHQAALDFYRRIRKAGCVAMRLHANVWPKAWFEAADEVGMPIIMESALFCYSSAYALSKPEFWDNYHEHLRAIVRNHRNHPSIVMISLENEILHCRGDRVEGTEARLAEAGRLVKRLDPTRPILYDGDADPDGVADVVNLHYPLDFNRQNLWPDVGYWLEGGMEVNGWPRKFWAWDRKKPLYFGEFLHIQHYSQPDPFTVLLGDSAYLDYDRAMAKTKAMAWQMQVEAYRAAGVSGVCPWTLTETGDFPSDRNPRYLALRRTYQKNAAFIREYDCRFYAGEKVERTVYLYNDTLHPAELTFTWQLARSGTVVDSGREQFQSPPADKHQLKISMTMPQVEGRTRLSLMLRVSRDGQPAFEESRQYWVFPKREIEVDDSGRRWWLPDGPLISPDGINIALFEGSDRVLSRLFRQAGLAPAAVTDLAELPQADVLVIGPHALDGLRAAESPLSVGDGSGPRQAIADFVRAGGSVVVLEQDDYPSGLLPVQLVDRGATIAFQRTHDREIFAGTQDDDFRFWRPDHLVARKTLMKPRQGRFRALVDSGGPAGLVYLPLLEILDGRGRYLLCQLLIGEKLDSEPVARLMLENLIRYAATNAAASVKLAVVQEKLSLAESLDEIDAVFSNVSGRLKRTDLGSFGVLMAETDAAEVAAAAAKIRQFVADGGRVVLHGGTPDGLARLHNLFPEPILAQRNTTVPISVARRSGAINGLSNQDLYWYGSRQGLNYRVRTPLSTAVAEYSIVAGLPALNTCTTVEAESMSVQSGEPRINPNDVYLWAAASIGKEVDFRRSGEYAFMVRGRGTPVGGVYPEIAVMIDGRRTGSVTTDGERWGTYTLAASVESGRHEVVLAFVNDAHDPEKDEDRNVSLDSLTYGPLPPTQSEKLLRPAALVKVPLGKGFYLVDQVRWADEAASSDKAARYLSNLLMNLGCDFATQAAALTIPGDHMLPEENVRLHTTSGGIAALGTNGTVYQAVRFGSPRRYQFSIRASGTEAAGEFPHIVLGIDGEPVGDVFLRRPDWHTLRLEADVPAGPHKVSLSFTNDFYDPPADRNLKIANLQIR